MSAAPRQLERTSGLNQTHHKTQKHSQWNKIDHTPGDGIPTTQLGWRNKPAGTVERPVTYDINVQHHRLREKLTGTKG